MTKQNVTTNIKPCLQHSFVSLCSSRFDGLPPSVYGCIDMAILLLIVIYNEQILYE